MEIGNSRAGGAMSEATAGISCCHGQPRSRDEPSARQVHNAFILLVVALFDTLVQFHRLAAQLHPSTKHVSEVRTLHAPGASC